MKSYSGVLWGWAGFIASLFILLCLTHGDGWRFPPVLLFLVVEAILWVRVCDVERLNERKILHLRMRGYAELKGKDLVPKCVSKKNNKTLYKYDRSSGFEVALGAAKKVELKAGALLTVWAIIAAAAVTIAQDTAQRTFLAAVVLFPMLALIRVFRQIDNFDSEHNSDKPSTFSAHLYKELTSDLVAKERCFRFAYETTFALIISAIAVVLVATVFEIKSQCSSKYVYDRVLGISTQCNAFSNGATGSILRCSKCRGN